MIYEFLEDILIEIIDAFRPPDRSTVSEAASKYRIVHSLGSSTGPWDNDMTPYMVEPMDTFASRDYDGMAFVGPAQSGKTDALIINTVAYSVRVDPMDMLVYCPTGKAARDFSIRRIDRLHVHSPKIGEMLLPDKDANNTFDKRYKSGMMLTMSYPTVTELAGRPVPRVVITDFDRIDDDIGGDGNSYDLASQRTNTFGTLKMCVAESSPSRPVEDPRWLPKSNHEAPPCKGIIGLYNRGDKRRWYWPCPHCNSMFEGEFKYLIWDKSEGLTNLQRAETVRMVCPECGCEISPDERFEMNLWGMWVKDGMYFDEKGILRGEAAHNTMASFWLKGVAAAFSSWRSLVKGYLDAEDDYARTLDEGSLIKFYNNSLGEPYVPKSMLTARTPEGIKSNAEPFVPRHVPEGSRFLVACADVQADRFVVIIFAIMPGTPFDTVVVDRFECFLSQRLDEEGNRMPLRPASYLEDWDILQSEVMDKTYPLEGDPERHMRIKLTMCDSGGKSGTTTNAYNFYRKLKEENQGHRLLLVKGHGNIMAPRVTINFPDSNRKDRLAAARGDVPVMMINTNVMKDTLSGRLDCTVPGKGMYRFPDWMPDEFYNELCAETRESKGWINKNSERNEAWDLSVYCLSGCISTYLNVEKIRWDEAPTWAKEWDDNSTVFRYDADNRVEEVVKPKYTAAELAKLLA